MKIRKDNEWNDIIVTTYGGSTMHFYNDLEDAVDTMKYLVNKARVQADYADY